MVGINVTPKPPRALANAVTAARWRLSESLSSPTLVALEVLKYEASRHPERWRALWEFGSRSPWGARWLIERGQWFRSQPTAPAIARRNRHRSRRWLSRRILHDAALALIDTGNVLHHHRPNGRYWLGGDLGRNRFKVGRPF